jgi:hypothetical protein
MPGIAPQLKRARNRFLPKNSRKVIATLKVQEIPDEHIGNNLV